MSDITANPIQIAKNHKIDCINGWVNVLAILLYVDIFLGVLQQQGEQIDGIFSNFTIRLLILFTIGAIACILIMKILTVSVYVLYLGLFAQHIEKLFPFQKHHSSAVSAYELKEYAMINNNDVIAQIATKAKNNETKYLRNTLIKVGTLILICLDFYYRGAYMPKIISEPSARLVIVIICILICIGLLQSLYGREAQIVISSEELHKQITGENKSYIKNDYISDKTI